MSKYNNPIRNIRNMNIIFRQFDGTSLSGIAENFRAIRNTIENGEITSPENVTDPYDPYQLADDTIKIQGECKIEMTRKLKSGSTMITLNMTDHKYNSDFSLDFSTGQSRFNSMYEGIKILTERCHEEAQKSEDMIKANGMDGLHKMQKSYISLSQWETILLLMVNEHRSLKEKLGIKIDELSSITYAARGIIDDPEFKIHDNTAQLTFKVSQEVYEKWINPIAPCVIIDGSDHSSLEITPYGSLIVHIHRKIKMLNDLGSVEIMKLYQSLPEITGPYIEVHEPISRRI